MFDTMMLSEAFRKYHAGEHISDDEIVEILRFLEPIERDGWVLDSRFALFVVEIREISQRIRGFMSTRVGNGRWQPTRDIENPKFLMRKGEDDYGQS